jgi:probable rRNA maturation factor
VASPPTGKRRAARPDVRVTAFARAPLGAAGIARLATAVLVAERARLAALSITLVGPGRIRALNRTHLGRDRQTDVIAFALEGAGDVYICPAVALRQARAFGASPRDEIRRLVIHGVLHVLGHDHPDDEQRTRSPMWRRQERYLARYGSLAR